MKICENFRTRLFYFYDQENKHTEEQREFEEEEKFIFVSDF